MDLNFEYCMERDMENFIKSFNSRNNNSLTTLQNLYIKNHGRDLNPHSIRKFLLSYSYANSINIPSRLAEIQYNWNKIKQPFSLKAETIFKNIKLPPLTAYLTLNSRCTYNIRGNYFFVYLNVKHSNAIIMHELFHFYTWYAVNIIYKGNKTFKSNYNDFKEALTELLNVEFIEFMNGYLDKGYYKHQNLRKQIRERWIKYRNVNKLIELILLQ